MKVFRILLLFFFIIIFSLIWFYNLFFLRQPERNINIRSDVFISPANWKIVEIYQWNSENIQIDKNYKKAFETYTKWVWNSGCLISIMMTPLNVHFQRAMFDSKLIEQNYYNWKFYNAMKNYSKVTFENEHNEMLFETDSGLKYKVIQIAWVFARRIESYINTWDYVDKWQVIWLIKFWSQVSILLPWNVDIVVKIWDVVIDWETIIWKIN